MSINTMVHKRAMSCGGDAPAGVEHSLKGCQLQYISEVVKQANCQHKLSVETLLNMYVLGGLGAVLGMLGAVPGWLGAVLGCCAWEVGCCA